MKRKIGRLCMVLGAVLILSAAGLLGYNRWDAARAEKASQEVLGELEQTMQKTITEHRQENETAAPQPVLDPAQEMTTVEVEGHDYIGVLSIPAAGLELPVMAQWSYAGLKVAPGRYSGTTYADDQRISYFQLIIFKYSFRFNIINSFIILNTCFLFISFFINLIISCTSFSNILNIKNKLTFFICCF